jgi:hypothetical protein
MKCTLKKLTRRAFCIPLCRNALLWLLALLCCLTPLSVSASPEDELTDLTITYEDNETPIEEAPFALYHLATVESDGTVSLDESFEDAQVIPIGYVDEDEYVGSDWNTFASTFESYILVEDAEGESISPIAEGETDNDGKLVFDSLEQGIYLLTGESCERNGDLYVPTASVISLPYVQTDGTVDYSPDIIPKYSIHPYEVPSSSSTTPTPVSTMHVQKIWKDNSSSSRPASVTVMLFKDGEKYDEVVLNEKNSWYYTWSNLDPNSRWQLGEVSVPSGYTVLTETEGSTFVVTNTLTTTSTKPRIPHSGRPNTPNKPQEVTTETPVEGTTESRQDIVGIPPITPHINSDDPTEIGSETPSETPTDTVDNPPDITYTPSDGTPDRSTHPTLPQTGQLWWPVPLLAFGGIIVYLVGKKLRMSENSGSNDEK